MKLEELKKEVEKMEVTGEETPTELHEKLRVMSKLTAIENYIESNKKKEEQRNLKILKDIDNNPGLSDKEKETLKKEKKKILGLV